MYHTLFYFGMSVSAVAGATIFAREKHSLRTVEALPCPDGTLGRVTLLQEEIQSPFQPAIYVTECSPPSSPDTHTHAGTINNANTDIDMDMRRRLEKRAVDMCGLSCLNACSWDSSGPAANDCSALTNYLQNRGSSFTVDAWQRVTAASGTCMTTFLNLQILSVTWCDSSWASQTSGLASGCSAGGTCLGLLYEVIVANNPGYTPPAPTPSTTNVINTPTSNSSVNPPATTNQGTVDSSGSSNNGGSDPSPNNGNTAVTNVASNVGSTTSGSASVTRATGVNIVTASGMNSAASSDGGVYFFTGSIPITTLSNGSVVPLPTGGSSQTESCTRTSSSDQSCSTPLTGVGLAKSSPLSDNPGAIVAIIIGIVTLMGIFVVFLIWRRRRRRQGQVIIIGDTEEEKTADNEKRRSSYRAYTISDGNSTGFGRVLQNSATSPSSPRSPTSIRSPISLHSVGTDATPSEVPVAYVPFWDLLPGGMIPTSKGTVSELGLDGDDDKTSVPSCYSGNKVEAAVEYPSEERGSTSGHEDIRYSTYSAIRRHTVVDADLDDTVRSQRVSSDEGHQHQAPDHQKPTSESVATEPADVAATADP